MKLFSKLNKHLDWILVIRVIVAGVFIAIGIVYKDWLPAIFGLTILITGIIANKTKTGCGYGNCNHSTPTS